MGENSFQKIRFLHVGEDQPRRWVPTQYWDQYKDFICDLIEDGKTNREVVRALKDATGEEMKYVLGFRLKELG
jgi:hypothetical protein